jgi:hypothetical protein
MKEIKINNKIYSSFTEYLNSDEYKEYLNLMELNIREYESAAEKLYNSLSYDDKMMVAFHVFKQFYDNEFNDNGSYRHLIYTKLGFTTDAYATLMDSGLLSLHNAVFTPQDLEEGINKIFKFLNIEPSPGQFLNALNLLIGGSLLNVQEYSDFKEE